MRIKAPYHIIFTTVVTTLLLCSIALNVALASHRLVKTTFTVGANADGEPN